MNSKSESKKHQISAEELRRSENNLHVSSDYIISENNENSDILCTNILNCNEDDKSSKTMRFFNYYNKLRK